MHACCRYKLTGETGSYRYMAPEVFRHEPYNTKARRSACTSHPAYYIAPVQRNWQADML